MSHAAKSVGDRLLPPVIVHVGQREPPQPHRPHPWAFGRRIQAFGIRVSFGVRRSAFGVQDSEVLRFIFRGEKPVIPAVHRRPAGGGPANATVNAVRPRLQFLEPPVGARFLIRLIAEMFMVNQHFPAVPQRPGGGLGVETMDDGLRGLGVNHLHHALRRMRMPPERFNVIPVIARMLEFAVKNGRVHGIKCGLLGGWTESRCDSVCLPSRHFVAWLRSWVYE